jgi:hypothetical protein
MSKVRTQELHYLKLKPRRIYQAQVHSGQTVLMVVRQEAGLVLPGGQRCSNELESNSRQPRDLTENRQSDILKYSKSQLTLFQGMVKKGVIAVDE